ncbi:hypothetical protein EG829_06840 [bacterium]|nr:hypothetical protein [bacterium]
MSELRRNLLNGNWTLIAPERGVKPTVFQEAANCPGEEHPGHSDDCPFCPGNADRFPLEVLHRIDDENGEWTVRTINNKYKLFDEFGHCPLAPEPYGQRGPYSFFSGCGNHFLVIETRDHDRVLGELTAVGIRNVLAAYAVAIASLKNNPNNLITLIFKNQGPRAGASQSHAHSQIVGSRIVPSWIRNAMHVQDRYFDDTGCCAMCRIADYETRVRERVISETELTVTLSPYAASAPYEVWIVPKRHVACFEDLHKDELDDFAGAMQRILASYIGKLHNPDFNYFLHSAPHPMSGAPFYHLYLQIHPRLSLPGGFEVGTNIPVNTVWPEDAVAVFAE